jgi:uncharacterized protein (DUF2141 family)
LPLLSVAVVSVTISFPRLRVGHYASAPFADREKAGVLDVED